MENENNYSLAPQLCLSLKHLPPIDPFRISNKGKLNNSCSRAAAKAVKQNPNLGMTLAASVKKSLLGNWKHRHSRLVFNFI
ncbi:hypothetical protein VNO78_14561 [Psophocarpus tetragonolobus]|uniref:Uncharacterized protein n=1 Tax=Psophocarpus tetragonolobus TaxID=3891 RepID=A0AAN9SR90_PSOTE